VTSGIINSKNTSPQPSPCKGEGAYGRILEFIVWGAGIAAIIGIIQFILQFIIGLDQTAGFWRNYIMPFFLGRTFSQTVASYPSWLVNIGGHNYLRALSTFPDPHMFSFYLGLTLPIAIAVYVSLRKKIYLVLSLAILLADLLTFSRGGYAGLLAGLIFVSFYFIVNKKINKRKLLVSLALILVCFVSVIASPVGKRFSSSFNASEGSNKGRFENWTQAVDVIANNPLGVGIGNYSYEIEPSADYRKPIYAHNLYLDIAAETGIINAIIFILILIFSIKSFIIKSRDSIFYLGCTASILIFSTHSFFDAALYSVHVLPLILIIIALSTVNESCSDVTHVSDR
jgi:O-antigen ligase